MEFVWCFIVVHGSFYFVGTVDNVAFLWLTGCLQLCLNMTKLRVLDASETLFPFTGSIYPAGLIKVF